MNRRSSFGFILFLLVSCSADNPNRSRDAEFHYSLAVNNYYEQRAQEALRDLQSCFDIDPRHILAHNLAGLIYLGRKEYVDSLLHFKKAVEIDPKFLEGQANLGALHIAMQDWQKAIDILTPLARDPLYPTPYLVENNIGWAFYQLGDLAQAEKHIERAIFLNDKMCLAHNNLGIVNEELKRFDDALDSFEAAISRCPDYVEPYFRAASILIQKSNMKEAQARLEKCAKLGGDSIFGRRCKKRLSDLN